MSEHFEIADHELDQVTGGGKAESKPHKHIEVLSWTFRSGTSASRGDDDDDSGGGLLIRPDGP